MKTRHQGPQLYHPKVLKQNQLLRDILWFIDGFPNQTVASMMEKFGLKIHIVQSALRTLRGFDFITADKLRNSASAKFCALAYKREDLDLLLPTTAPENYIAPDILFNKKMKDAVVQPPVARDWMTAMLMGSADAPAPSLNFMRSTKGADHAESQAVDSSH